LPLCGFVASHVTEMGTGNSQHRRGQGDNVGGSHIGSVLGDRPQGPDKDESSKNQSVNSAQRPSVSKRMTHRLL
jgi:hypothetical protein